MDKITKLPTPLWICKKCFGQFTDNVDPHTKAEWFTSGRVFSPDTDVCDNPLERYISLDELHKQIGMNLTHWVDLNFKYGDLKSSHEGLVEALKRSHACATVRDDGTCDGCFVSEALKAADGEMK